jgi:hypothetical protein
VAVRTRAVPRRDRRRDLTITVPSGSDAPERPSRSASSKRILRGEWFDSGADSPLAPIDVVMEV